MLYRGILFAKNYALNNPTKKVIINMSLGRTCEPPDFFPISQAMQDAINLAWNSGVLVVASAGNTGGSLLQCPASATNTIAVSATNNNDDLASFSSFGTFVDLAAPGVGIYNALGGGNNLYTFWSGTSFSSPIVAGVAGLVWSANMSLSNAQVDQILRDTADNIGSSFFFGDGRVNANSAVLAAGSPPPIPNPTPTPPPASNPVLTALDPGESGGTSSLSVSGADPAATINFKYSEKTGTSFITGGGCAGQSLDLKNQHHIGTAVADGSGNASISVPIPSGVDGLTVHLQAYSETPTLCGFSNRVTQTLGSGGPPPTPTPTPTPTPPPSDPVLTGLNPGIAGSTSSLAVTGAPVGETIRFKYSFNTGSGVITGGVCAGQALDLDNHKNIGTAVVDGSGKASLNILIPENVSGATAHLQAYTKSGSFCGISNRVTQFIQ